MRSNLYSRDESFTRRTAKLSLTVCITWLLMSVVNVAMAQGVAVGDDLLAQFRDFTPSEDLATRVLTGLLGETFASPMTSMGQASTLFGAVFMVFNVVVFAVGTVWGGYGMIAGIVQTAHEGVVLGKRMSAIWMPIRMVTGIGGLVPAFGGFSLSQVAMILATGWGVHFGNYAYNQALDQAANTDVLVNPGFSRTEPKNNPSAMALALFAQQLCFRAEQQKALDYGDTPQAENDKVSERGFAENRAGEVVGRKVGSNNDNSKCYAVGLKHKPHILDDGRNSYSMGFRSGAVDYEAISQQAWNGYSSNFPAFAAQVQGIADTYYNAVQAKTGAEVPPPIDEVRAAGASFSSKFKTQGADGKLIKQGALENMRKYGFFALGSFYSTFAEATAAAIQAADATEFIVEAPKDGFKLSSGDYEKATTAVNIALQGTGDTTIGANRCFGMDANATGNCSFGQKLVGFMMDIGTAGSGGSSTMIDPILALKNIGDYMMTLGETILGGIALADSIPGASTVASAAGAVLGKVPGVGMLAALGKSAGPMLPVLGGLMFAVGALCSLYIPMVPFINWVSALVQLMCIIVEAMAAAPLWALAHIQADGEGMGQRTEKGYLYLLNLLFRPILMVVSFFAAAALIILLGSVVMQMFMPAIAAAQGNSVTGIFSAVGYVFLFFVVMNTLIQGLFHLVMELSDDAIGWVGGIGRNNIGRDAEGKINQMFMMGGRFGAGAAGPKMPTGGGGGKGVSAGGQGGDGGSK